MFPAVLQADLVNISKEDDPDLVRHMDFINFTLCEMNIIEEQKGLQENLNQCHPEVGPPLKWASKGFRD